MKLALELSARLLLRNGLRSLGLTGWISFTGLVLGVACLVVSMAVVSGFEQTLQNSVSDLTGHIQILKSAGVSNDGEDLGAKLKGLNSHITESTRVLWVESVAAAHGKVSGVLLQGLDFAQAEKVLSIKNRLIEGEFLYQKKGEFAPAFIGKALAKKFALQVGDQFRIVVPLASEFDPGKFQRRVGTFLVAGILDLGKLEFDERFILADLGEVQKIAEVGDRYSGVLLKLDDIQLARSISAELARELGFSYRVRDWRELNENMFEAVKIEKVVIFFVILIIIIAAAFNVSSALYISVLQRYPEIGIFKAMGLSSRKLISIFSLQGLIMGGFGCILGFLVGLIFCFIFSFLQTKFGLLPGSVYKLDRIEVAIQFWDVASIFIVTLMICFLATLAPAMQGARLTPVEGLRYE